MGVLDTANPDWGIAGASAFTRKVHHDIHAAIDPTKVKLRQPYVVCIVGASRGIGAGVAHAYAHAGASGIVLASRRVSGLEQTAADCKKINPEINAEIVPCDITSDSDVQDLARKTEAKFGRLDVLVINSGFSGPMEGNLTNIKSEDYITTTMVNYIGTFLCAKHLIPLLLSSPNGAKAIIAINSIGALIVRGPISHPAYGISKTAQLRLMEMVHEQHYRDDGLVTYTIHPGSVATEMALESAPRDFLEYMTDSEELCGGFCVWLTKDREREWLSGRFLLANWDVEELEAKRDAVVKRDLLKLTLDV